MATLPNPLPRLTSDPSGRSLGLQLPPGRVIDAQDGGAAVLWCAQKAAAPGTWAALGAPAGRAGLVPVLVDAQDPQGGPESWGLAPEEASYPGDHDAEEILEEYWAEDAGEYSGNGTADGAGDGRGDGTEDAPEWPGLAPAPTLVADPDARAAEVADSLTQGGSSPYEGLRLALVPARRSADVPAALGWSGAVNYEEDVARLCAVLRSWEERFGIRVVALSYDRLSVSVAAPPATPEEAEALALEHLGLCPYAVLRTDEDTLEVYAKGLIGAPAWHFWWD
ncbi:DUF4253 domain-containing protein [Streptomyces sp. NPDC004539]|uniref:DUF4253 domain-containing protein n=1 Tax=Streptomyces sp. NPDC004539 TaxID=3154280 RepID=UPI0033A5C323